MKYIILAPSRGSGNEPWFWKANSDGYKTNPFLAGHYEEEQIKNDPGHYNNGFTSVAIALTEKGMETIGFKCSYKDKAINQFMEKTDF